jgi:hypothetical protein
MPPNSCADRAAQLDPVLQHPVGQPEKVNHLDSDDPGRLPLFGLADPTSLGGVQAVDAGFAAGHHGIHHGLSLISPASDRRRGTEFKIIWVGDDAERGVPRLVDRFEIWHAA